MLQLLIVVLLLLDLLLLLQPVVEKVQLEIEQPHEVAPVAPALLALPDEPVLLLLMRADRHLGQRGQLLLVLLPHAARRWGR